MPKPWRLAAIRGLVVPHSYYQVHCKPAWFMKRSFTSRSPQQLHSHTSTRSNRGALPPTLNFNYHRRPSNIAPSFCDRLAAFRWKGGPLHNPVSTQPLSSNNIELAREDGANTKTPEAACDLEGPQRHKGSSGDRSSVGALRTSEFTDVRNVLTDYEVNPSMPLSVYVVSSHTLQGPIRRFWKTKNRRVDGELGTFEWKHDGRQRAKAIALYILMEKKNTSDCHACAGSGNGPGAECIAGPPAEIDGACTNCYYSGTGKKCSLRVEYEKKAERERLRAEGKFIPISEDCLGLIETAELETWVDWIEEELVKRRVAQKPKT
ncbi:uncharacterized protein B0I36DRAFT_356214 [Microdochium trichocladiopsis]|uniref:Uncharacterized protein n=1 Tax=Microdochium trichocladiopsis TaxID=1682393 RepID=A0A9P8XQU1_9PEZI|nr:uncharacterized protein B0I36DRAFT_356214 [Microdochium trichocladiopsis]KAH7012116.1 hypothetical protein B0I36DRAFT_356214 [Microdochium trichocladiopsis]